MNWFHAHPFWTFVIIFVLMTYVYNKVFRVKKLPVLKDLIIYLLLAVGAAMLMLFQLAGLPIVPSLTVAVALMFLVRIRYFVQDRANRKQ
ncbi:YlaH-like family protein [Paenibacillus sp. P26]|nr:YlaH-like family protein [Paenibacillus sp. P26]UUZ96112.1 YlaH-like family protein [Paenibacillus sp. P25]